MIRRLSIGLKNKEVETPLGSLPFPMRTPNFCYKILYVVNHFLFRWSGRNDQRNHFRHSSSKLLRKDYGHAGGFLSLCIRSIYCHFLSGAAETCREVGSQIFFGVVAAMDLLKLAPSSIFARSLSLSLSPFCLFAPCLSQNWFKGAPNL